MAREGESQPSTLPPTWPPQPGLQAEAQEGALWGVTWGCFLVITPCNSFISHKYVETLILSDQILKILCSYNVIDKSQNQKLIYS